tara:strand:- start:105 stop:1115 length:1011 start_codon:yes stop_codon:yes gene_type:complete
MADTSRNEKLSYMLYALGSGLRGQDPVAAVEQIRALRQKQATTAPTSYQEYLLTDATPTAAEYASFLKQGSSPGTMLQLINKEGNFVKNVTRKEATENSEEYAKQGFRLTSLPTGTEAAPTASESVEARIQPLVDQFKTGSNLIKGVSKLANDIATNPEVANTLVASGANAIEFLKSNLEGFVSIGSKNKNNPIYKNLKEKAVSIEGTDFTDEIQRVSDASAVAESQILDLAFTFAAARGQEGRGLSDRDFQNALDILSKGVNAEQKIAVMKDVARRISSEYTTAVDIARRLNAGDEDFMNKVNQFETLPVFADPFAQPTVSTTTDIDQLVKEYTQ